MADTRRLPDPNVENWEWQLRGACRGIDSSFFFHPEGERGAARVRREARAKAVCRRCPVLADCRQHALTVQEPYGIWGGMSESERDRAVRERTRELKLLHPGPGTPSDPADPRDAKTAVPGS
jgi:WhiB family redox-sensing transcriptional regulator